MLKTVLEPEEGFLFVESDAMMYLCVCETNCCCW